MVCVEPRLLELVRGLPEAADGVEIVVDCEPPGLAVTPARAERLERCCRNLLASALLGAGAREIDLCLRADLEGGAPVIYVSMRRIAAEAEAPAGAGPRRFVHSERHLLRDSDNAILLARRDGAERRLTLALDMPFEIVAEPPSPAALATRVLVADDNPRVRRVARRLLERRGFEVAEANGAVALLAELDPQRRAAPPDWVLIDEGWLRPEDHNGRGLLPAVEAAMPAGRVVLLSDRRGRWIGGHRRLAKPFGGEELQTSLGAGSPPERNVAAEMPYSLSL